MKGAIIILAGVLALMVESCMSPTNKNEQTKSNDTTTTQSVNAPQIFDLDTTKLKSGETFYQCSMDLEVLSDQPGSCPKCGMDLSEMKKQ